MKTKLAMASRGGAIRWLGLALLHAAFSILPLCAATNDLTGALQKGLFEEEANHNLDAAAQAYQNVSAQFDKDRKLAATAIFRLGEVYRKQGKTNEATFQYERIVREFSDQSTLVTLSRQSLVAFGVGSKTTSGQPGNTITELETKYILLNLRLEQAKNAQDPGTGARVLDDANLTKLWQQHQSLWAAYVTNRALKAEVDKGLEEYSAAEGKVIQQREAELASLRTLLANARAGTSSSASGSIGPLSASEASVTDEEEKEIRRIQAMIKNSPDLINAPGGGGPGSSGGFTPLHTAANAGQLTVARFLLDSGAEVNSKNGSKETPLTLAAAHGHKAMVELLLARGADVNATGGAGYTALHQAALFGFKAVAEVLLANKVNVNATSGDGSTPLHLAASAGNTQIVELLLNNGAKVNAKDDKGHTPLLSAAFGGRTTTIKVLLAAKAEVDVVNMAGRTALSLAAERSQLETVKALLDAKADPNLGQLDLPLAVIVYGNRLDVAELLLQAGADPNLARKCSSVISYPGANYNSLNGPFGPYTPLQMAVARGFTDMVKLLFKFKADPNTKDAWYSPPGPMIDFAVNKPEIFKAFLDAGFDPNGRNRVNEIYLVAVAGNPAITELLLTHGAKVDAIGGNLQQTALLAAVAASDKKSVELLLAAKANANLTNSSGYGPLHYAVNQGSREFVEALLAHGADVNAAVKSGDTPLHLAARVSPQGIGSSKEMISLLLAKGANPNLRNNDGLTPLDLVKGRQPSVIGLRPPIPPPGNLPYPYNAKPASPEEIAEVLRKHGALDELPNLDRIEIRIPNSDFAATVFTKDANDWNRYTLLDALFVRYFPANAGMPNGNPWNLSEALDWYAYAKARINSIQPSFPDLHRIVVVRPAAKPGQPARRISVDLLLPTGVLDCSKDVPLEFGDKIEILEREHTLEESAIGLSGAELKEIGKCRQGTVTLLVRGKRTELKVGPLSRDAGIMAVLVRPETRSALFSSSDLSRLKVTRRASLGQKEQTLTLDCSAGKYPDFWLRDGDVIEVLDKP